MHQGSIIDELILNVERAEEHALAVMEMQEQAARRSGMVYQLPRAEALIGVA